MPAFQLYIGNHVEIFELDHGEFISLHLDIEIGITRRTFELPNSMPHDDAKEFGKELDRVITGASI